jgi:hypothetical protein
VSTPNSEPFFQGATAGVRCLYGSILSFVIFASYIFFTPHLGFQHDAKEYWEIGTLFVKNGHFSLFNYDRSFVGQTFRGYSFPLLCLGLQSIARLTHLSDFSIVGLFSASYFAILCGWLIPALLYNIFGLRPRLWQTLALSLCLFIFWRGYLCYPLTDFTSLFLLIGALNLIMVGGTGRTFWGGILLGLACNMRPAYSIALYLSLIFAAAIGFQAQNKGAKRWLTSSAMLLGAILVLIPQSLINHRNFHSWSPGVVTTSALPRGLFFNNMELGFTTQRFETNVGQNYPTAGVLFVDPGGVELLRDEGGSRGFGYRMLARTALRTPLKLAALYWRHICNAFDIKYSTVYVPNIYDRFQLLSLLNYTIIYIAIVILLGTPLRQTLTLNRVYVILIVAATCAVAIPVRIETRYFLPGYVSLYILVIFYPSYRSLFLRLDREKRVKCLVGYVAFLVMFSAYSENVFRQIAPGK